MCRTIQSQSQKEEGRSGNREGVPQRRERGGRGEETDCFAFLQHKAAGIFATGSSMPAAAPAAMFLLFHLHKVTGCHVCVWGGGGEGREGKRRWKGLSAPAPPVPLPPTPDLVLIGSGIETCELDGGIDRDEGWEGEMVSPGRTCAVCRRHNHGGEMQAGVVEMVHSHRQEVVVWGTVHPSNAQSTKT